MSNPNPVFDPTQPYQAVPDATASSADKPPFDPNQTYQDATKPAFDPNQSFATPEDKGGIGQTLLAGERGIESGLTAGFSNLIDKYRTPIENAILPESLQQTPDEKLANAAAHPVANVLGNVAGSSLLLAGTGMLGGEAVAAKLGLTGIKSAVLSNVIGGALLSGSNALSNDLAFGDPNLNASKIASDVGIASLWGGGIGGVASGVLGGASLGLKSITKGIKAFGTPDLSVSPESLSWLDKLRMGTFSGMQQPENLVANKFSNGLNALHDITSMDNLSTLGASGPEVDTFNETRTPFLKQFGDPKTGKIDPSAVLDYITNPASKNSTAETVAFNNHFNAIKGLSNVKLNNPASNESFKAAQEAFNNWSDLLSDYGTQGPEVNMANVGSGEAQGRVASYGNERVSPFEYEGPSLNHINNRLNFYKNEVLKVAEQAERAKGIASDVSESLNQNEQAANQVQNLKNTNAGIQAPAPNTTLDKVANWAATPLAYVTKGASLPVSAAFKVIRNYSGDGGFYKLGNTIATPLKIVDGVANKIQQVDQRIGDKARLIFTAGSNQMREAGESK